MKKVICTLFLLGSAITCFAQHQANKNHEINHDFDPPWNTPPKSSVLFTIAGIDNVPDLYGDINDPQLVVFFAGNQYMCIDSLVKAFKQQYPVYKRIFIETLPPGILAQSIRGGTITIGNLRITQKPDVYTAGRKRISQEMAYLKDTVTYTHNRLAIMVAKNNPHHIQSLTDLGRENIRVSMPNPAWEGIAGQIQTAYELAGGPALKNKIMVQKVKAGTTILTKIHHRETPINIMEGYSDAGPVWQSEALYHEMLGHPVTMISISDSQNVTASYVAGILKNAPHPKAAKRFRDFLASKTAKDIYAFYGFENDK
ncbi:substrate-binding domain-containing protein [Arachidicoccus ginsenosidivorans]|uniref:ABC transporter substrate-binding protein n=1 Tax=Arachidicoccus ginsenosidivorans TaxID=496057 RepID=A0A5B8VME1_9BACT|nr:substrate-binding domain-containing protein [Arachidicoccus ginsenosidivorans]QEC72122.1 ABC transporter substrate-binding protein [Arachidicoccus ginsenosidivorans]